MDTKTYVALGAGVLLVLWLMQKRPKNVITLPSDDPAEGAGHDPFQNTTNNASTSDPTLDLPPAAPVVTASGESPINHVSVSFNTSRNATSAATVSSKDAKAIRDRVYLQPTAATRASAMAASRSAAARAAAMKQQQQQQDEDIHLIGVPSMVWG